MKTLWEKLSEKTRKELTAKDFDMKKRYGWGGTLVHTPIREAVKQVAELTGVRFRKKTP